MLSETVLEMASHVFNYVYLGVTCSWYSCNCTSKTSLVDVEDIKGIQSDVLVLKIASQQALLPVLRFKRTSDLLEIE